MAPSVGAGGKPERLLSTREAARYLRVSEASIRRWSDSGFLRARRVGRRAERRFREDDLIALLQDERGGKRLVGPHVPSPGVRIDGIFLHFGSHLCSFYNSDPGRLRLALPFLRDGLRDGHTCFLVAGPKARDTILDALGREGLDIDAATRDRQLITMPGRATADDQLRSYEDAFQQAAMAGAPAMRLVAETASVLESTGSMAALLTIEERFTAIARRFPSVTICPYDARQFSGSDLLEALKVHVDNFEHPLGTFLN